MSTEDLPEIFKILSSHIKLSIIEALGPDKRLAFKELMKKVGGEVYSSLLSNHLRALRNLGYLEQDSDGKYMLSEKGVALYNIVVSARNFLLSSYGLRVISQDLTSYTLERYLASLIPRLLSPQVPHTKYQKLAAKIIEHVSTQGIESITEDLLLLHVLASAFEMNLIHKLPENVRVSYTRKKYPQNVLERVEENIREYTFHIIQKQGLIDIFKDNAIFMKAYPGGFLHLHVIDPEPNELIDISKKSKFFGSLIIEYNDRIGNEDIELIRLLDSYIPLTIIIKDVNSINIDYLSSNLFLNTLFIFPNTPIDKEFIKNATLLINSGNSLLFSSSKLLPSIMHFPLTLGEPEYLLISLNILLPVLYSTLSDRMKLEEYIELVCRDVAEKAAQLYGMHSNTRRIASILGLKDAKPLIQLSFVGLEALFIGYTPYFDIVRDESSTRYAAKYIAERASHLLSQRFCEDLASKYGYSTKKTFFAPLHPYHIAASHQQGRVQSGNPLYYHVNMYTALSFNVGGLNSYIIREANLQSLFSDASPSIAEIKLGARTSVFEIEDLLREMKRSGIITYTFSLSGLSRCSTCYYTTPYLRDVCPRCYSRTISRLYRPILAYVEESSMLLDRYSIDEYSSRPMFSKHRGGQPYQ